MSYHLALKEHSGYLHAVATGTHSAENMLKCFAELNAAARERGCTSILFELNLTGPSIGMTSIFEVVKERSPQASFYRKFAYVDSSDRDPANMVFAETVARNRGINVRMFRDAEAAKRWLSE